ncbi:histidine-rich glycoprotein-like [Diachasmimorpha longicaudata]
MKFFIVLFALVAAVAAFPGYEDPWQGWNAWKPVVKSGWQPSWPSSGWQKSSGWQPASAGWQKSGWQPSVGWSQPSHGWQQPSHGWQQHAHHVDAIQVPQQPAIPPLHPHPLHLKAHAHVQHIPYHHAHPGHPHLIGVEHAVHEPEVKHIIKPVHGHGW